jgi:hypothetical protein
MKKIWIILIIAVVLAVGLLFLRGSEDSWIKDDKGIYIKHGNPAETPSYVIEQQDAIDCANGLYLQKKAEGIELNSECLGTCGNYAVDVVHIPRNADDNFIDNQCADFGEGKVEHFIELDKDGEIVRIV